MPFKAALSKWVRVHKKKSETQRAFFMRALDDEALARQFLDVITKNPRDNKPTYRALAAVFTKSTEWTTWQNKYMGRYHEFIRYQWDKAKRIEDVLRIIPNYSPWALKDRFGSIQIGSVPCEFVDTKTYHAFLQKIYNSKVMQNYRQFKSLEGNATAFAKAYPQVKKIDWFDLEQRSRLLSTLLNKIIGHKFSITHAGHKYAVQYLCNPFSSKMVFRIESDTRKKYILKMLAHQLGVIDTDAKRKESENQAIRADSPYSNSLMEFYLKLNKCPHAPDILYYTDTYEAVLYYDQKGVELERKLDFKTLNNKYLKDANRLGIYVNDISPHNFIRTADKKLKIIDIGHASFANPLTQGVPGLTFTFGNLSGQDYLIHFGVLSMED